MVLVNILENVGDRILVLVAEQLGQPLGQALDAVDQLRRAVEERAEAAGARRDHRAALRAGLRDRPCALHRAAELNFADAREADALDLRRCALEHRGFVIDLDPHPHEFGTIWAAAKSCCTCPTGTPEKVTSEPLLSPLTPCAK